MELSKDLTKSNIAYMLKEGKILLDNGFVLSKDLTKEKLLSEKSLGEISENTPNPPHYKNYRFITNWNNKPFVFVIYYCDDLVTHLSFSFYDEEYVKKGWDGWCEKKEFEINAKHISLLKDMLGQENFLVWPYNQKPPVAQYRYDWGRIFAGYNERSADSGISISYGDQIK